MDARLTLPGRGPSALLAECDDAAWLETERRPFSRADARARVTELARRFCTAGLRPGDRVAWWPRAETEGILAALAALEAGAELALLPLRESPLRLEEELRRLEPRLVIVGEGSEVPRGWDPVGAAPIPLAAARAAPGLPRRVLVRSSGSSGPPRWLVHRLEGLLASAAAATQHLRVRPEDRWLLSLPLDHVGGLGILLRSLLSGCALRLPGPGGLDADLAGSAPSLLSLVPTQLAGLAEKAPPPGLRAVLLGGAPLDATLRRQAVEAGWPLVCSYGASETGSLVCATALGEADANAADSGRPLPPHRLQLDEEGRIEVDSPALFEAVLDADGRPRPRPAGWWRSQDLGAWQMGGLVVLGRADQLIISGGEKIRPEEVEEALRTLPEVAQAAVVALADPVLGQRPVAFIAWRAGALPGLAELRRRLEQLLARHKHPARVWPWPAELSLDWKPRREELRRLAEQLAGVTDADGSGT